MLTIRPMLHRLHQHCSAEKHRRLCRSTWSGSLSLLCLEQEPYLYASHTDFPFLSSSEQPWRAGRIVFEGVWEHGLLALVSLAGASRANATDAKATSRGPLSRGAPLPAVPMASAVAILFETPEPNFQFLLSPGNHVQCGQLLTLIGGQAVKSTSKGKHVSEQ